MMTVETTMIASKPIRRTDIVAKSVGREIILYGSTDEAIHILNPTAKLIWDHCDGEHTLADMEQIIRTRFSVPPERNIKIDISNTLELFAQKGLLTDTNT
jgi:hypothetical protein